VGNLNINLEELLSLLSLQSTNMICFQIYLDPLSFLSSIFGSFKQSSTHDLLDLHLGHGDIGVLFFFLSKSANGIVF
jgi:hypothetical protein